MGVHLQRERHLYVLPATPPSLRACLDKKWRVTPIIFVISIFYSPDMVAHKQEQKRTKRKYKECSTVTITAKIKNTTLSKCPYYTLNCVHSTQLTHKINNT